MYKAIKAYTCLQDDTSRFLYEKRCMWSLTGDDKYIDDIIESIVYKDVLDVMMKRAMTVSDRLVIRGIGNEYHTLSRLYPDLEFAFFVDRDSVKVARGEIDGHRVVSTDDFYETYKDFYVMITSSAFCDEIERELKEHGFDGEHIFNAGRLCKTKSQYFEQGIIEPKEHEIFIDGGCYDGTTFRKFAKWCNGAYERIYSFEPDKRNYEAAAKALADNPIRDVHLLNKGLWNCRTTLRFHESGGQGAGIIGAESGGADVVSIETTTIDEAVQDDAVTFIKLDVEGAEYEALEGAYNTIKRYHPRMAISVYHKPEDIFTIPELILSMSDDYRFYLRHYQMSRYETILYAV